MNEVGALDWSALVIEARRRRARDNLTQGQHANLAGVSRDTIRSFDRFEKTITLEKALSILKVVGLVTNEQSGATKAQDFINECLVRWNALAEDLPPNDPARLEHGYCYLAYDLIGLLDPKLTSETDAWVKILASIPSVSGWSPFRISRKRSLQPSLVQGGLECWFGKTEAREDKVLVDPPYLDFWRVSPSGALFILRGYQEDGSDSTNPGTFFDIGLPIWRSGDVVDHARLLVAEITKRKLGEISAVQFSVNWSGLSGRALADWSDPTRVRATPGRYRCRIDEVRTSYNAVTPTLGTYPDEVLRSLVQPLYQAFDYSDPDTIDEILAFRRERLERERWAGYPAPATNRAANPSRID